MNLPNQEKVGLPAAALAAAKAPGFLSRRSFLRRASVATGATVAAGTGVGLLGSAAPAKAVPATDLDPAVLNFALNLEYVEAEFYLNAAFGQGLEAFGVDVTGAGTLGPVTIKPSPQLPLDNVAIREYANEIAIDEYHHVLFLRAALQAAGVQPVARPAVDLLNSFNTLAQAAGLGASFDPFASDANFILGAFIFEDVGVTAYNGAATLLTNPAYLQAAASILAVEAYHSGVLRLLAFQGGLSSQVAADQISNLRAVLGGGGDKGVLTPDNAAQLIPVDENGLAFYRSTREVLNIVYGSVGASSGLFFPNGFNGAITS
ncbi:MAG TPA: ferritin-like domain-containing protein [Chthoniobacterales bacterium]